jgi:hypothetical protein
MADGVDEAKDLEDTIDHVMGKGIVIDQGPLGFSVDHTETPEGKKLQAGLQTGCLPAEGPANKRNDGRIDQRVQE